MPTITATQITTATAWIGRARTGKNSERSPYSAAASPIRASPPSTIPRSIVHRLNALNSIAPPLLPVERIRLWGPSRPM